MTRFFGYMYAGRGLAAHKPMTEEEMIKYVERSTADRSKFQIYELVPVELVTVTKLSLERK